MTKPELKPCMCGSIDLVEDWDCVTEAHGVNYQYGNVQCQSCLLDIGKVFKGNEISKKALYDLWNGFVATENKIKADAVREFVSNITGTSISEEDEELRAYAHEYTNKLEQGE